MLLIPFAVGYMYTHTHIHTFQQQAKLCSAVESHLAAFGVIDLGLSKLYAKISAFIMRNLLSGEFGVSKMIFKYMDKHTYICVSILFLEISSGAECKQQFPVY